MQTHHPRRQAGITGTATVKKTKTVELKIIGLQKLIDKSTTTNELN